MEPFVKYRQKKNISKILAQSEVMLEDISRICCDLGIFRPLTSVIVVGFIQTAYIWKQNELYAPSWKQKLTILLVRKALL